jgi:hypothetical protein
MRIKTRVRSNREWIEGRGWIRVKLPSQHERVGVSDGKKGWGTAFATAITGVSGQKGVTGREGIRESGRASG